MFGCSHVKGVVFLSSWLRWHLVLIKEVSYDCFGACGLWSVSTPIFEGSFYRRKAKFLRLSSVRSANNHFLIFFFGF